MQMQIYFYFALAATCSAMRGLQKGFDNYGSTGLSGPSLPRRYSRKYQPLIQHETLQAQSRHARSQDDQQMHEYAALYDFVSTPAVKAEGGVSVHAPIDGQFEDWTRQDRVGADVGFDTNTNDLENLVRQDRALADVELHEHYVATSVAEQRVADKLESTFVPSFEYALANGKANALLGLELPMTNTEIQEFLPQLYQFNRDWVDVEVTERERRHYKRGVIYKKICALVVKYQKRKKVHSVDSKYFADRIVEDFLLTIDSPDTQLYLQAVIASIGQSENQLFGKRILQLMADELGIAARSSKLARKMRHARHRVSSWFHFGTSLKLTGTSIDQLARQEIEYAWPAVRECYRRVIRAGVEKLYTLEKLAGKAPEQIADGLRYMSYQFQQGAANAQEHRLSERYLSQLYQNIAMGVIQTSKYQPVMV